MVRVKGELILNPKNISVLVILAIFIVAACSGHQQKPDVSEAEVAIQNLLERQLFDFAAAGDKTTQNFHLKSVKVINIGDDLRGGFICKTSVVFVSENPDDTRASVVNYRIFQRDGHFIATDAFAKS